MISEDCFMVFVKYNDGTEVKKIGKKAFAIRHGEEYTITIYNTDNVLKANARVKIDGKEVIKVRLNEHSGVKLDRGIKSKGKFTFFKADPNHTNDEYCQNGIVEIEFEKEVLDGGFDEVDSSPCGSAPSRGITKFCGKSEQEFYKANYMNTVPSVTIKFILLVDE